jgi:DNA-binding transcriptional ArsR family regulator
LIENIKTLHPRELQLCDDEVDDILNAADIITLARTGVETDYRGDIIDAHAPEMPTRFAKQLTQIMRGGIPIGMSREEALELALRCARDSVPQLRLAVLDDLKERDESTVQEIRRRLQKPWRTVNRALEALHALELIEYREETLRDEDKKDGNKASHFYRLTTETTKGLQALNLVRECDQTH